MWGQSTRTYRFEGGLILKHITLVSLVRHHLVPGLLLLQKALPVFCVSAQALEELIPDLSR